MKFTSNVLVVANGIFPSKGEIAELFKLDYTIVCCDGAVDKLVKAGYTPDIIIGDLDSISMNNKTKYKDILIHVNKQDNNDLEKALSWLDDKNIKFATILGADGGRDDHALGNLLLLLEKKFSYNIEMQTESGIFTVINTNLIKKDKTGNYIKNIKSNKNQSISLFCTNRDAIFSSEGLKYELENFRFTKLHSASLNSAVSDSFSIACNQTNILMLVYREN